MNDCDRNFKPKCPPVGPNVQCPVIFNRTMIDSARGDETGPEAPYKGKFRNTLVVYEATGAIYLFSSDGNFTFLGYGFSQITHEEVERLISIAIGAEAILREEADDRLDGKIDGVAYDLGGEITARQDADIALSGRIDSADSAITAEVTRATNAEAALGGRIDTVSGAVTAEATARETADTNLQTQITATDNAINKTVITDLAIDPNTSTTVVELDATKTNIKTSVTTTDDIPLPVASATQAGVMNAATFNAIVKNTQDIANIKGEVVAISGLPANPTQQELTTAWLNTSGEPELINGAGIFDVTNEKRWTYYANDNTWHWLDAHGSVQVNQWTNNTAGIVKGSTNVGQIFAESDGTGSVNGWDTLSGQVSTNTSKLATIESGAEANVQSNWTEADPTSDAYIQNKPTIDTTLSTSSNNAISNAAVTNKIDDAAYIGQVLSTPTSVAYVAEDNIQDDAVTTDKIADGAVTSDKIDSATLDMTTITPASGYSMGTLHITKRAGTVHWYGAINVPFIDTIDNQTNAFVLPSGYAPALVCNAIALVLIPTSPFPIARVRIGNDGSVRISTVDSSVPLPNNGSLQFNLSYPER